MNISIVGSWINDVAVKRTDDEPWVIDVAVEMPPARLYLNDADLLLTISATGLVTGEGLHE